MSVEPNITVIGDYSGHDGYEVSVLCTTFNQQDYIEQCVDSLLAQKADFEYKVIIHDDCSTDATREILLGYAERYPEKVVLLLEQENCYSRGMDIDTICKPYLFGTYVAVCEGDDWWLDESKLQRQYDYMQAHPECALCVHAGALWHEPIHAFAGINAASETERDFGTEEILLGTGDLFVTNSMFYPSRLHGCPPAYLGWGFGDLPTCLYLSTCGTVHYMTQPMSVYRMAAKGSYNERQRFLTDEQIDADEKRYLEKIKGFDEVTERRYHAAIEKYLERYRFISAVKRGDWRRAKREGAGYYSSIDAKRRLELWLRCTHPRAFDKAVDVIRKRNARRQADEAAGGKLS